MLTQGIFRCHPGGRSPLPALVEARNSIKMEKHPLYGSLGASGCFGPLIPLTDSSHHASRLRLKSIPLILLSICLGPLGNVLLGRGMKSLGAVHVSTFQDLLSVAQQAFSSAYLWMGVACLLSFFLVHMLLLTWADYSYVQPATALAYVSVALLSRVLLHEVVSPLRWTGIITICFGVLIVGRTSPNTTGAH